MNLLQEVAVEYAKLFENNYLYTLKNGAAVEVYFAAQNFHHLIGLQKLKDVDVVMLINGNNTGRVFKNIIEGRITFADIKKSIYFDEIEGRLRHFNQISRIIEFEKIIVNFNQSLLPSTRIPADYILYKRSNDNQFLNLFLKKDKPKNIYVPLTFIPHINDYYINGQEVIDIISVDVRPSNIRHNKGS